METKKWNEYTDEEKKQLLNHWWYYYGKIIFTFEEWERFNELIDKDADVVFEIAIASFLNGYSSQVLISAMRQNKVDELIKTLPDLNNINDPAFKSAHAKIENLFLEEITSTLTETDEDKKRI